MRDESASRLLSDEWNVHRRLSSFVISPVAALYPRAVSRVIYLDAAKDSIGARRPSYRSARTAAGVQGRGPVVVAPCT